MINNITMVGCGVMGSTLIGAMMDAGLEVTIIDLNEKAAQKHIANGAKFAKSLNDIELSDVILFNLPMHKTAYNVLTGCDKNKLKGKMLIDTTTSTPAEVEALQKKALEIGMKYLDAKLEVYPGDIGRDTGYVVYSGGKDVFDNAKNALDAIGQAVYLGEDVVGASVTDLAVLEVHFAAIAALIEASAFGIKNNYSVPQLMEQIEKILPIMIKGNFRAFAEQLENYTGKFEEASACTLNIETTAAETIVRAMKESGIKTPCGDAVVKMFNDGIEHGYGDKDVVAVVNDLL